MENELVQQIDRLISMYQWSMSIFLAILALVLTFIGVLQWRLSSKQIEKIKSDVEKQMVETYELESLELVREKTRVLDNKIDNVISSLLNASADVNADSYEVFIEKYLVNILENLSIYGDEMIPFRIANKAIDALLLVTNNDPKDVLKFTEPAKSALNAIHYILKNKADATITESANFKYFESYYEAAK